MFDACGIILEFAGPSLFGFAATQRPPQGGWHAPLAALVGAPAVEGWQNPLWPLAEELQRIQAGLAPMPANLQVDPEQLRLAIAICSSQCPLQLVAARAGTGKSHVLKLIAALWSTLPVGNSGLLLMLQPVRLLREETAREHLNSKAKAATQVARSLL